MTIEPVANNPIPSQNPKPAVDAGAATKPLAVTKHPLSDEDVKKDVAAVIANGKALAASNSKSAAKATYEKPVATKSGNTAPAPKEAPKTETSGSASAKPALTKSPHSDEDIKNDIAALRAKGKPKAEDPSKNSAKVTNEKPLPTQSENTAPAPKEAAKPEATDGKAEKANDRRTRESENRNPANKKEMMAAYSEMRKFSKSDSNEAILKGAGLNMVA